MQPSELKQLIDNETTDLLNYLLIEDNLQPQQGPGIIKAVSGKHNGYLITDEMGLGKSYVLCCIAHIYRILFPDKKVIITAPTGSVTKIKNILNTNTPWEVLVSDGRIINVQNLINNFSKADILLVQHSTWENSIEFNTFIYNYTHLVSCTLYDESRGKKADGMITYTHFSRDVCQQPDTKSIMLNATAFDGSLDKIYNILYGICATNLTLPEFKRAHSMTLKDKSQVLDKKTIEAYQPHILNVNREDIGIIINIDLEFHRLTPTDYQRQLYACCKDIRKALFSPLNVDSDAQRRMQAPIQFTPDKFPGLAKTFELLSKHDPTKNLVIYSRTLSPLHHIKSALDHFQIKNMLITGENAKNPAEKERLSQLYNQQQGCVALITLEEEISLNSADSIILYETPNDVPQTIYRIIRGNQNKNVQVHWLYYPEYQLETLQQKLLMVETNESILQRSSGITEQLTQEIINSRRALKRQGLI